MLWSEAEKHLRSEVDAVWAASLYAPILLLHENLPESLWPTLPETFVICEVRSTFTEKSGFGSPGLRVSQEGGMVMLHAFVPAGIGTAEATAMIDVLTSGLELRVIQERIFVQGSEPRQEGSLGDSSLPGAQPGGAYYRVTGFVPFNVISTR